MWLDFGEGEGTDVKGTCVFSALPNRCPLGACGNLNLNKLKNSVSQSHQPHLKYSVATTLAGHKCRPFLSSQKVQCWTLLRSPFLLSYVQVVFPPQSTPPPPTALAWLSKFHWFIVQKNWPFRLAQKASFLSTKKKCSSSLKCFPQNQGLGYLEKGGPSLLQGKSVHSQVSASNVLTPSSDCSICRQFYYFIIIWSVKKYKRF